jgi:hypothetical protein
MSSPRLPKCPKCGANLKGPRENPDGLPGIKYMECEGCGYTRAVTTAVRKEKLS